MTTGKKWWTWQSGLLVGSRLLQSFLHRFQPTFKRKSSRCLALPGNDPISKCIGRRRSCPEHSLVAPIIQSISSVHSFAHRRLARVSSGWQWFFLRHSNADPAIPSCVEWSPFVGHGIHSHSQRKGTRLPVWDIRCPSAFATEIMEFSLMSIEAEKEGEKVLETYLTSRKFLRGTLIGARDSEFRTGVEMRNFILENQSCFAWKSRIISRERPLRSKIISYRIHKWPCVWNNLPFHVCSQIVSRISLHSH